MTPNIGEMSVPRCWSETKKVRSSTDCVSTRTYQPRISVSISNAQEVARSAGHWNRKARILKGAKVEGRAVASITSSSGRRSKLAASPGKFNVNPCLRPAALLPSRALRCGRGVVQRSDRGLRLFAPDWLWIPITIGAAAAQTGRNAAQRHLTPILGTLGATLVRFLYGLPFALLWLAAVALVGGFALPQPNAAFAWWIVVSSVTQIGATALLLRVMAERNFALGTAYAKTEIVQVALFALLFLGDPLTPGVSLAVVVSTVGVMLLAPIDRERPLRTLIAGWTTRP